MWAESSGQRSNPGKTNHCWSFVPFPCMGIEFTARGFSWRHGQHPTTESNVPLNPLFWIDGFCRLCAQPLDYLMGLCIPQVTDRKFCFRGCIQIDADRQTSSWSSSGTEGRRTALGVWSFKAACDSSVFPCSLLSSPIFGCQLFSCHLDTSV